MKVGSGSFLALSQVGFAEKSNGIWLPNSVTPPDKMTGDHKSNKKMSEITWQRRIQDGAPLGSPPGQKHDFD